MWIPSQPPRRADSARGGVRRPPAGQRPRRRRRSSRTATRRIPPITSACSRTGCATRRSTRPTCARRGSRPTCSRSRGFTDEIAAALRGRSARVPDGSPHRSARARGAGAASTAFGWQPRPSPNPAGLATACWSDAASPTRATSTPRTTSRSSWRSPSTPRAAAIVVRRVVCAHDCGLVVNPDALRNQIEGAIVQTLSRALHEEVPVRRVARHERRLGELSDPEVSRAPAIEVILFNRPEQPLWGAGEASTVPVAAALGQRGLRCDRRAAAPRAVHGREGQGGAGGGVGPMLGVFCCQTRHPQCADAYRRVTDGLSAR